MRNSRQTLETVSAARRRTPGRFFPYPSVGAGAGAGTGPPTSSRLANCMTLPGRQELIQLERPPNRRRPLIPLQQQQQQLQHHQLQQQQQPLTGTVDLNQPEPVCFRKSDPNRNSARRLRPMSAVLTRSTSFTTTDYGWLDDVTGTSNSQLTFRPEPLAASTLRQVTRSLHDLRTKENAPRPEAPRLMMESNTDAKLHMSSSSSLVGQITYI